jgi:hypothetical protein
MMDLSNKALALILVIATAITLVGTTMTLSRLGSEQTPVHIFTGRATSDTGTSNFTINSTLAVAFVTNAVEFGTGVINATGDHNCTLNTTGPGMLAGSSNPITGPDCIGFNASVEPLRVQNQGTQNVTLNISFNATAASFVGGTTPGFAFRASWNETGACGNASLSSPTTNLNSAMVVISAANTNYSVCNSTAFDWRTDNRTLNLDLGISVPQDAPPGARRVTITAYASSP